MLWNNFKLEEKLHKVPICPLPGSPWCYQLITPWYSHQTGNGQGVTQLTCRTCHTSIGIQSRFPLGAKSLQLHPETVPWSLYLQWPWQCVETRSVPLYNVFQFTLSDVFSGIVWGYTFWAGTPQKCCVLLSVLRRGHMVPTLSYYWWHQPWSFGGGGVCRVAPLEVIFPLGRYHWISGGDTWTLLVFCKNILLTQIVFSNT